MKHLQNVLNHKESTRQHCWSKYNSYSIQLFQFQEVLRAVLLRDQKDSQIIYGINQFVHFFIVQFVQQA